METTTTTTTTTNNATTTTTTTTTKRFIAYILFASSVAVAAAAFFFFSSGNANQSHRRRIFFSASSSPRRVWPVIKQVGGELAERGGDGGGVPGSAFGTVGGVGGGGVFVPLLNLVVGFDTKSAAALSKCMIMGASTSSVWYNLQVSHPTKEVPIIDYNLALLFQPMLMLGITIGVELSVVFPFWLITVLIIILFLGTSSRSFFRGIQMWKQETILKMETEKREAQTNSRNNDVIIDSEYVPLLPQPEEKSKLNGSETCSIFYWAINILQIPIAASVFAWEAVKLWRESRARRMCGNMERVCEASIDWTAPQLLFCALCGLLGGTVGGLLGSGGGFILGPLLLEIGVIPQVASATATFVMMFSSSLSVVEFYFLKRFPIPYALYLISVSVMAGFWASTSSGS
uniref:Sulfite exporter TauE/SafE family protein n=1 Tax=Ananas comosus var. bracteatus TaxID=296719 RepID=A0A6V7QWN6_ANACO